MLSKLTQSIPKKLNLFDVSLRDGLQTWKKIPTLHEKKNILKKISQFPNVKNIEVGSIVSSKILPQFQDSIELYHYTSKNYKNLNPYLLIPNVKMHEKALYNNIQNMSFITSVSEEFQKKNTKLTLQETKNQIKQMIKNTKGNTKLYISCINECPISGFINEDIIINEIIEYIKLPVNEICLSDTCGSLTNENLNKILNILLPVMQFSDVPISKLSFHLHKNKNENETQKILNNCINRYIFNFDVSNIDGGGCSVTMNGNINGNLNYDDFAI
tara:strand:- start:1549 stop:2364 length:816 start_codon:yes stop_codon:yes gene_type:complete